MSISEQRTALIERMIGPKIPRLWCPPLMHYTGGTGPRPYGRLDLVRMKAHWRHMCPYVGGFLVPGSTGDGWDMDEDEHVEVVDLTLDLAVELGARVLIGVLRTDIDAMRRGIAATVERLKARTGESDPLEALRARNVAGFTITAPKGRDLSQAEIQQGLEQVLAMGLPMALYQLPQITENEISPEVFCTLAERYPNLLLFKDTSGGDSVAREVRAGISRGMECGVFLMRGAEGGYAQALEEGGGCYQGFLLSSANNFANALGGILALAETSRMAEAGSLSDRVAEVVTMTFDALSGLPHGTVFANGNKAIDHFMAYGPAALEAPAPMLHAGVRLPRTAIELVGQLLTAAEFVPEHGYLV
jgi:dihydrodipicolinate synthase/N-acetylneuraminate lyase